MERNLKKRPHRPFSPTPQILTDLLVRGGGEVGAHGYAAYPVVGVKVLENASVIHPRQIYWVPHVLDLMFRWDSATRSLVDKYLPVSMTFLSTYFSSVIYIT